MKRIDLSRRRALRALAVAGTAPLAGCGALVPSHHKDAVDTSGLGTGKVLVVGRIELLPALRPGEQKLFERQWDPFKVADGLRERAVLYLSADANAPREPTGDILTPPLDRLFFVPVPEQRRCVAHALIHLENRIRLTGPRSATQESSELWLPAPVQLDLRSGDRAVYVGTWRIWRDDFNEVLRTQVFDHYAAAQAEAQRRFGSAFTLRKALAVLPGSGATRGA